MNVQQLLFLYVRDFVFVTMYWSFLPVCLYVDDLAHVNHRKYTNISVNFYLFPCANIFVTVGLPSRGCVQGSLRLLRASRKPISLQRR